MNNICLTPTPNLRCQSLSWLESVVLLIPPAFEVVFCAGLMVNKRGSRSKLHYLLASEGLVYFILTMADFIVHQVAGLRGSLLGFKALDIIIGIMATIPLLLFSVHVFLLASRDLIPMLPSRFQGVVRYTLLLCIPVFVSFNLMSSFDGLAYRKFQGVIAVKFTNEAMELFLSTLTLVVFTVFQVLAFCASLFRIVLGLMNQRRIDHMRRNEQQAHLFNGMGWIALGIKLGAVETVIGIVIGEFGHAITRRILRLLGRACLVIGALKGLDTVEDFRMLNYREQPSQARSNVRDLISAPIDASFRQVGGYNYEASFMPPPTVQRSRTLPIDSARHSISLGLPAVSGKKEELSVPRTDTNVLESPKGNNIEKADTPTLRLDTRNLYFSGNQRVTVRYRRDRAPTLVMQRLSGLLESLPSPLTNGSAPNSTAKDPGSPSPGLTQSAIATSPYDLGLPNPYSTVNIPLEGSPLVDIPQRARVRPEARRTLASSAEFHAQSARRNTMFSPRQTYNGSERSGKDLELLHALAMQIPDSSANYSIKTDAPTEDMALEIGSASVSRSTSERTTTSRTSLVRRASSVKRKPVPAYDDPDRAIREGASSVSSSSTVTGGTDKMDKRGIRRPFPVSAPVYRISSAKGSRDPSKRYTISSANAAREQRVPGAPSGQGEQLPRVRKSFNDNTEDARQKRITWEEREVGRIKSVGRAPRMWTPPPSHNPENRNSMVGEFSIESEDIV